MARVAGQITLSRQQERLLRAGVRARKTPQHLAMRMRIILRSARGLENLQIAAEAIKRKVVDSISIRHVDRSLKGCRSAASQVPVLDDVQGQVGGSGGVSTAD